jgi:hypothetical protein
VASFCQDSSCGTVNYRPYVGGKIRWRYGTEPWQEITGSGLTYTTEIVQNLTQNTGYQLVYESPIVSNGILQGWTNVESKFGLGTRNGISAWSITFVDWKGTYNGKLQHSNASSNPANYPPSGQRYVTVYLNLTTGNGQQVVQINTNSGLWGLRIEQTNAALRSTSCKFKIFKNGVEVRSETRATCPEVQLIPASLSSETKSIAIQKAANLERTEVNNTGIPPECLNIYTTSNTSNGVGSEFKAQICSSPGSPPPQYEVICCAPCDSCPAGTCPIECGGQICCYGADGISVKSIALANYCSS